MTRWAGLLPLLAVGLGCSGLQETDGGVIAIEIETPSADTLQIGETMLLAARALNAAGDTVTAGITWVTPDTTIVLEAATGQVTGRTPGNARVQAVVGSLASPLLSLTVVGRPDTLIIASDSSVVVAPDQAASPPLVVRVESFAPPAPLSGSPVSFTIVSPTFPDPATRTVELAGAGLADTLASGPDGTVTVTVARMAGIPPPDSALVEVGAVRRDGTPVPGSGQRFTVRFPAAAQ